MVKLTWNPPKLENLRITHAWTKDYAALTHEGGYNKEGHYIQPRQWTDATLAEVDFAEMVAAGFSAAPLSPDGFVAEMRKNFLEANEALALGFDAKMLDEIWEWDGLTVRQDGSVVGSPRDIYSTGSLMGSRIMSPISVA